MFRFDSSSQQKFNFQSKQTNNSNKFQSNGSFHQKPSRFLQQKQTNLFQEMPSNNTQRKSNNKFDGKDQAKLSNRSPYRPKLIQHLIDSSDSDNNSFMSDQDNNSQVSDQYQEERFQLTPNPNKLKFDNKNDNYEDNMGKSYFTNRTQQTALSKATKVSKTPTEITNIQKTKNHFFPQSDSYSSSSHQFISQNDKKSSGIQIKYDTLKLSQYDKKQAASQNELYLKNRKQFQENMPTTKIKLSEQLYKSNLFESNKENDNILCVDSLQEMKMNDQRKISFEKKIMCNSTISMDKSYAMKSVSQILKNQSLEDDQELNISRTQSKNQQLRLELKRSKDVIKTLTLKNSDLQKTLQMQNVQLQQLQSEKSSQIKQQERMKLQQNFEKAMYERINQYMRFTVKQFMQDVKDIKMSPLLEQSLEQFMTQLLQIDSYSVNKKLGITNPLKQIMQEASQKSQIKLIKIQNQQAKTPQRYQNLFKTVSQQTKNYPSITRSHAFMSNRNQPPSNNEKITGGKTVKLDLSSNKENYPSNKENITPNKKPNADQQFKLLEKSLNKLKNMEKQLQSASPTPKLSTPVPKRQMIGMRNKYRFQTNQDYDEQRSQYSLINRRDFSTIKENNQMNISSSNLDRSKSRRKKIFSQANRNQ